ncbi:phage tail fiber repeat family protein [Yersinia pseudotuberculosis]|uniref:phage tail-collar fiber domain-containing protein n=1 Tax=Yersinia pseudotuberculosis TaxID=633 RepID=UPI0001739816|nr:phage tail protein [Yersinia pseudotuberculosis]CQD58418.1 tail fiber repeat 2-containing protein [Yersinia intermedia]AJJ03010.1 phage tail fiber repeat family protein [Yersinia pseudotuberculosis]AJJ04163.1 phage tail fiber repeat family protein [Yersinia pseudotuberculosis]AJJ68664.1 phage tail fiber repeat family protein [Yersinia pseudotuberculosis PB1/+]AJJ71272.1 phage tail fiber repeat family protein [Yersinia pseudotuberculosis]
MATVITRAFEHWQAGQVLNNLPARPDTIIFAHVPGLDPAADINPDEGIPADGQIVHRDVVAQYGMINDSAVAYSVVLDTRQGDFTFNWIGLVDAASNTLCMIVHTPAQQKIATTNGVQGNNITRTFLMEFAGAAEASQITVSAQTWQIDFSARLRGIDEVCRLANLDYYGHAAFFGDGFSVSKDGDKYRVKAGLAYVGGIRALLADDALLEAATGNVVYADVSYQGSVLSEFAPIIHLGVKDSAGDFDDYTDANGFAHYITPLALITASGEEDKRDANPFDKAIDDINAALKEHAKSRDHPDATLSEKGFIQLSSAVDSDSETLAATLKAVKITMENANARLAKDRNGADIANVPLFRQNIGIKGAALLEVGTTAGTVAAGNDSRIVNALQSDSDLSDVLNKLAARGNLGLGNSSVLNTATNAEMAAGSSTTLLPTVAAVMSLFSKRSLGTIDYIRIPDVPGGILIQFGTVGVPPGTGQSTVSANFAIPFTTPPRGFSATCYGGANYFTFGANPTITGFTGFAFDRITTAATFGTVFFIAIGN